MAVIWSHWASEDPWALHKSHHSLVGPSRLPKGLRLPHGDVGTRVQAKRQPANSVRNLRRLISRDKSTSFVSIYGLVAHCPIIHSRSTDGALYAVPGPVLVHLVVPALSGLTV